MRTSERKERFLWFSVLPLMEREITVIFVADRVCD